MIRNGVDCQVHDGVMSVQVRSAVSEHDLDDARRLIRGLLTWQRQRPPEVQELVEAYFDEDDFERELRGLPGEYGPPDGELLLAEIDGHVVGVVASHRIGDDACEMKRMFVETAAHGRGAGRALAVELILRARASGFRAMFLDTSRGQTAAIALYRSLGFVEVPPYTPVNDVLRAGMLYFRRELSDPVAPVK